MASKILQITAAVVAGKDRHFVNVYGLADDGHVYRWRADKDKWEKHVFEPRNKSSREPGSDDDMF